MKSPARAGAKLLVGSTFVALIAACGASTGLEVPDLQGQSVVDGAVDDASVDGDAIVQPGDAVTPIDGTLPPGDAQIDDSPLANDSPGEPDAIEPIDAIEPVDAIEPSDGPIPPGDGGRPGACMASCSVDTDCVTACGTPRNGSYCCDTASGACFHSRDAMCPIAGADGGMGGS